MSDYTKTTNFTVKDSTHAVILGAEIDTEFSNIETAVATKANSTSPTLVTPVLGTPASGTLTNCTGLPAAGVVVGTDGYVLRSGAASTAWASPVRGFLARKNAVQTIPDSTATDVAANFTEHYDTHSAFNTTTGVVTIPTGVNYVRWSFATDFAANATGIRQAYVFQYSGTAVYPLIYAIINNTAGANAIPAMTSAWIPVVPGDTFALRVYQSSGGALNLESAGARTYFAAEFAS